MAPVFNQFLLFPELFETRLCVTAQHREMLDQVLSFFGLNPHYDLDLMKPGQNLHVLTADVIVGMKEVYEDFEPDFVLVHGDTTTSFAASLAAFYLGIKVAHVEAGLRTYNKLAPFPEEVNRQLTSRIAEFHFAPTATAQSNLLKEGIGSTQIFITGNTVIDALMMAIDKLQNFEDQEILNLKKIIDFSKKTILVTGHRRENFGDGFVEICEALLSLAISNPEIIIVYPVHLNPNVLKPVHDILGKQNNIYLIEPLAYPAFVWLMNQSYIIITDSGGIQEEAPSLHKPVLVMRETTERPEALSAGLVKLVGTNKQAIIDESNRLLKDQLYYESMTSAENPYGKGDSARLIVEQFK